jgi:hypothetical protein
MPGISAEGLRHRLPACDSPAWVRTPGRGCSCLRMAYRSWDDIIISRARITTHAATNVVSA